jgi:hypothetical protein
LAKHLRLLSRLHPQQHQPHKSHPLRVVTGGNARAGNTEAGGHGRLSSATREIDTTVVIPRQITI